MTDVTLTTGPRSATVITVTPTKGTPMTTIDTEAAANIAYCEAYVDAVSYGDSSALHYMHVNAASLDQMAAEATDNVTRQRYSDLAGAYRDCIRVLDIAAEAALRAVARTYI